VGGCIAAGAGLASHSLQNSLADRTEERGPVAVRLSAYEAGWAMIQEHPLAGWTAGRMYDELARRMEGYNLRTFYIHNTYLALLLEFGAPGLLLYAILFFNLFRLGRAPTAPSDREADTSSKVTPLASLRRLWPIMLAVYLFNGLFVDMAYQFVIGTLFTVAGMLCAQSEESL
jgi:O-antigen ligase